MGASLIRLRTGTTAAGVRPVRRKAARVKRLLKVMRMAGPLAGLPESIEGTG